MPDPEPNRMPQTTVAVYPRRQTMRAAPEPLPAPSELNMHDINSLPLPMPKEMLEFDEEDHEKYNFNDNFNNNSNIESSTVSLPSMFPSLQKQASQATVKTGVIIAILHSLRPALAE